VLGSAPEDFRMRFVDLARASALFGLLALLSACPKKGDDVVPELAPSATSAQPTGASDKAGAEAPAAAATPAEPAAVAPVATPAAAPAAAAPAPAAAVKPKKKDDQGGW
jgi:hypothetical protein